MFDWAGAKLGTNSLASGFSLNDALADSDDDRFLKITKNENKIQDHRKHRASNKDINHLLTHFSWVDFLFVFKPKNKTEMSLSLNNLNEDQYVNSFQ